MVTSSIERIAGVRTTKAIKVPALVATTANITLSGEQTIDAVAVVAGGRVLVKDQTDATQNGIYDCGTGDWRRARDFDSDNEIGTGTIIYVIGGTAGGGLQYTLDTVNPQLNVSNLSFSVVASSITGYGAALVAAANAAAAQAVLDLEPGTDVQAQNDNLSALSGLTLAANKLPYATGPGAMTLTDISAFARTLLDDADAATARATLGTIGETQGSYSASATPSTSGTITLNADTADWIKIGNLCFVTGILEVGSVSSPSGSAVDISLPFVPKLGINQYGEGFYRSPTATIVEEVVRVEFNTTADFELHVTDVSAIDQFDRFQFGLCYITN